MTQSLNQKKQSTVVRLFSQLKGQRIRLAVVAVSIVLYVGLSIYTPMYSALVIDRLWQSIQAAWKHGTPFSITWTNMGQALTRLSIQYFFTWIFYYLQSWLMANVAESLNLELRRQIAHKLNRLPLRFFDQNKAGEILSRVTSDLDKIADVLQTGLLKMIVAIGTIIGSLVMMLYYSASLTIIFLIFIHAHLFGHVKDRKIVVRHQDRSDVVHPDPRLRRQPGRELRRVGRIKAIGQDEVDIVRLKAGLPQELFHHPGRFPGIDRADDADGVIGKLALGPRITRGMLTGLSEKCFATYRLLPVAVK